MSPRLRFVFAWLPPVLWAAVVFGLSAIPGTKLPQLGPAGFDKLEHASVYAMLGVLCFRAVVMTTRLSRGRAALAGVLLAALYGVTDEIHQIGVPNRQADPKDALADTLGAAASVFVAHTILAGRARARARAAAAGAQARTRA